jgi:hypothetical protein
MNKDLRIPLDLASFSGEEEELDLDFDLTDDEKKAFQNVLDFKEIVLKGYLSGADNLYKLTLTCKGSILLRDGHDFKRKDLYSLDDQVDLTIDHIDEENSDIHPEPDGSYDLRSSLIALLYDAIPKNYSEIPLKKIVTDDYTLLSEEENERQKNAGNNPFAVLDSLKTSKTEKKPAKKTSTPSGLKKKTGSCKPVTKKKKSTNSK